MTDNIENELLAETYNTALDLEKSGDVAGAIAHYLKVLDLDPLDHGGARVRLAALGHESAPSKAPDAYVATLFDQHAAEFEEILVGQLGYDVPNLMRKMLVEFAPGPFAKALDVGCGTGLAADALSTLVRHWVGFDLSEEMVSIAFDKETYDDLYVAEAVDFLASNDDAPFELIVAADVFPYVGDVSALIAGIAKNTLAGGHFVFSTQTLAKHSDVDFKVGADHRFHHRDDYVLRMLRAHGFSLLAHSEINVRNEDERATPGALILARLA